MRILAKLYSVLFLKDCYPNFEDIKQEYIKKGYKIKLAEKMARIEVKDNTKFWDDYAMECIEVNIARIIVLMVVVKIILVIFS